MKVNKMETNWYLSAPILEEFFKNKRKNDALMWIPLPCSMLFSDELQKISTTKRGIFFSFLLLCGVRGSFEIPFKINYLSKILGVNKKTLSKGINELTGVNLLHKRERQTEQKE